MVWNSWGFAARYPSQLPPLGMKEDVECIKMLKIQCAIPNDGQKKFKNQSHLSSVESTFKTIWSSTPTLKFKIQNWSSQTNPRFQVHIKDEDFRGIFFWKRHLSEFLLVRHGTSEVWNSLARLRHLEAQGGSIYTAGCTAGWVSQLFPFDLEHNIRSIVSISRSLVWTIPCLDVSISHMAPLVSTWHRVEAYGCHGSHHSWIRKSFWTCWHDPDWSQLSQ